MQIARYITLPQHPAHFFIHDLKKYIVALSPKPKPKNYLTTFENIVSVFITLLIFNNVTNSIFDLVVVCHEILQIKYWYLGNISYGNFLLNTYFIYRFDARLTFANLKNHGNNIEKNEEDIIWIPQLIFDNTVLDIYIDNDALSSVEILKNGPPTRNPQHELLENYLYSGDTSPLIYSRDYDLKFTCEFELQYFPFDHQNCYIMVSQFTNSPDGQKDYLKILEKFKNEYIGQLLIIKFFFTAILATVLRKEHPIRSR